jgi:ABC-type transport system involved in multi-copper enzyme maturation permease subunit
MNPVIARLIAKDLYLQRWLIGIAMGGGLASLAVTGISRGGSSFGMVFYLTTVIAYGIMLVMHSVGQERHQKSLVFVLSLPISPAEYLRAKMIALLLAFIGPWALLTIATLVIFAVTSIPDGMIPYFSIISVLMLMNFCIVLAAALISKSEPLITLIIIVTNASVSLLFILLSSIPAIADGSKQDVLAWPRAGVEIMGVELAVALIAIALPFALGRAGRGLVSRA